jgi:hypothetical protein
VTWKKLEYSEPKSAKQKETINARIQSSQRQAKAFAWGSQVVYHSHKPLALKNVNKATLSVYYR